MSHPAALEPVVLTSQCDLRFTRRSGPGGQNRNKVETAVVLTHRPTGISAEASERRTQGENREAALFRLRLRLAVEIRTNSSSDGPSPLWRSRCRGAKIVVSPAHLDFPALLAEALNALAASEDDPKVAADFLGVSATQLVRFLKLEPRAMTGLNERRRVSGLRPLL